jgi:hypothetical protein
MRIAFVTRADLANSLYRSIVPAKALERRGHHVDVIRQFRGEPRISLDQLSSYDVVHVYRLIVNEDESYVARLHEAGVRVCFDNDDDIQAVTPQMWEEMEQAALMERIVIGQVIEEGERSLAMLPQMDLVTTTSASIAERYRSLGARDVEVIPNYLPSGIGATQPVRRDGLVIGWHACDEHEWDRRALGIDEMLRDVLAAHEHAQMVTVGIELDLPASRYTRVPHVVLPELFNHLAGFDIGIAPLADIPFNRNRSDVKVREYACAGVPWLASPIGPYKGYGREEGGSLVADGEWFDALDRLIRSSSERSRQRKRARKWAKGQVMDQMVDQWEDLLFDVVESGAPA